MLEVPGVHGHQGQGRPPPLTPDYSIPWDQSPRTQGRMDSTAWLLLTIASAVSALDHYEQAMAGEVDGAMLREYYTDNYDLKPESKDFLPDDYFDSGSLLEASKMTPTFTEGVKKALLESATKKRKQLTNSVTVKPPKKEKQQAKTQVAETSAIPPSKRDPTFVLSRLLYHMARLPPAGVQ